MNLSTSINEAILNKINDRENSKVRSVKGKYLIIVVDKSGSMAGSPFEAVKKGILEIGKVIYDEKPFEKFIIMYFDDVAESHEFETY